MHTIQYASSRKEVWRWYWRTWAKPSGLWLFHFTYSVLFAIVYTSLTATHSEAADFVAAGLVAMITCLVMFPLWPQIKFKSSVRTLTIDTSGLSTTIGKLSATESWAEIGGIADNGEEIVIVGKNRNAFIIPKRAFQSEIDRQEFLKDAIIWHSRYSPKQAVS